MRQHIEFSIVVPTLGSTSNLRRLLTSLLRLDATDSFELIVIFNNHGSDKKVIELLNSFRGKMYRINYQKKASKNTSEARNVGISLALGEYVIFLDDDVSVSPLFLKGYRNAWKKHPNVEMIGGAMNALLNNGNNFSKNEIKLLMKHKWCFGHQPLPENDKYLQKGELVFAGNLSMKRKNQKHIFNQHLGVQVSQKLFIGAEDYELCFRTLLKGKQIILSSDPRVAVEHHISASRFNKKYISSRYLKGALELAKMEDELSKEFNIFSEYGYIYRAFENTDNIKKLVINKYERNMLIRYLLSKYVVKKFRL
jgi:glycosyltransferase involved in cell wall biosynthesis